MTVFQVQDETDFLTNPRPMTSIQGERLSERHESANIPDFEGQEVAFTKGKITSVSGLEIGDQVFRMDETVRLVVETRVVGIDHKVNPTSGKLERVHLLKALDSVVIGWEMDLDKLREELA